MERLNLSLLEYDGVDAHADDLEAAPTDNGHSLPRIPDVSRRQALAVAGVAAAGASPAIQAVNSVVGGQFTLHRSTGRVAFRYRGRDRWIVDTKRYGGHARLEVEQTDSLIRVRLTRARYPGTDIPAGFTAEIRRGISGWRMALKTELGLNARVPFEHWLMGKDQVTGRVSVGSQQVRLGHEASLAIGGRATVSFLPSNLVRIRGKRVATAVGLGGALISDSVAIGLAGRDDPSPTQTRRSRRTTISILRGAHNWDITLPTPAPGARLQAVGSGFDVLAVETAETAHGHRSASLIAFSDRPGTALLFTPSKDIFGAERTPFSLALVNARLAMTFGPDRHIALAATYHQQPTWLHINGASVLVGDRPAAAGEKPAQPDSFLLSARGSETTLRCAPAILGVAAGLEGVVVEPQPLTKPTNLEFAWEKPARPTKRRGRAQPQGRVSIHPTGAVKPQLIVPDYVFSILRPDDMMSLRLEYVGWTFVTGGGLAPNFVRTATGALVIAHFAPQNIAEQAYFYTDSTMETPAPAGDVSATISGPSRLAFDVDPSVTEIAYSIPTVMDWTLFTQHVAAHALPPGKSSAPKITRATPTQTSIESPFRIMVSPSTYAYWNHTPDLVPGPGGEVELWHTRLGVRSKNGKTHDDNDPTDANLRTIRAIWSPDYVSDYSGYTNTPPRYDPSTPSFWNPYRASTDANDRAQIVALSSDFNASDYDGAHYIPTAVNVNKFMLTALGSWMNVHGTWDDQIAGLDVVDWTHRATQARDDYVRIVYAGYMFPFGHKAVLVKVTERKFYRSLTQTGGPGPLVAYLFQHEFIIIREPVKTFWGKDDPGRGNTPPAYPKGAWTGSDYTIGYDGRNFPFKSVELKTIVTPDLEDPSTNPLWPSSPPPGITPQLAFWPTVSLNGSNTDVLWHVVGTDWDGKTTSFTMPLVFIDQSISRPHPASANPVYSSSTASTLAADLKLARKRYLATGKQTVSMGGKNIAFAPSDLTPPPGNEGVDPSVETTTITFGVVIPPDSLATQVPSNYPEDQPQFYPTVDIAAVKVPAIKHMLGTNTDVNIAHAIEFLKNGFDGNVNKGEVYIQLVAPDFPTSHMSKQVGMVFGHGANGQLTSAGPLSPNLSIAGLSRMMGPIGADMSSGVSDLSVVAGGTFDPTGFLGSPASVLGSNFPKLFGAVNLWDILNSITNFTDQLNKVPGFHVKNQTNPDQILVRYFWETDQIKEILVFHPSIYDSDGNDTAGTVSNGDPPPPPTLDDSTSGSVNTGTHLWAATYVNAAGETILGLPASLNVTNGQVTVTVNQGPAGTTAINIYRAAVNSAWPLGLVGTISTNVVGMDTVDFTDNIADSAIGAAGTTWCQFGIDMNLTIPLNGDDPTYSIVGEICYCSLDFDVIAIPFTRLEFTIQTGAKLDVNADVGDVVFKGPLQFVNKLRDFLSAFGDPPFLDVGDTEVNAGYTLSIPDIDVGAFSLQNIAFGAKITVPYFGDAVAVGFTFCSKENPFILTIYIFGGGGWLEIDLGPTGIVGFHAGFEFGVDCALNLGIASGSVHIMAGIYYDHDSTGTNLTGFVDAGGSLDILGIISLSVDFHLQLSYSEDPSGSSTLVGSASVTVEVSVLFVSFSVTLGPVSETFAGSNKSDLRLPPHHRGVRKSAQPLPINTMIPAQAVWDAYAAAYA